MKKQCPWRSIGGGRHRVKVNDAGRMNGKNSPAANAAFGDIGLVKTAGERGKQLSTDSCP
jgi:hypothetical protein